MTNGEGSRIVRHINNAKIIYENFNERNPRTYRYCGNKNEKDSGIYNIPIQVKHTPIGVVRLTTLISPIRHNQGKEKNIFSFISKVLEKKEYDWIPKAIVNNELLIATDGSCKGEKSGYAVVFHSEKRNKTAYFGAACPSTCDTPSSLYPELLGALAATESILHWEKTCRGGRIRIYTDNKSVVNGAGEYQNKAWAPTKYKTLFLRLQNNISSIKSGIQWNWIKAHSEEITAPHLLNERADLESKRNRESSNRPSNESYNNYVTHLKYRGIPAFQLRSIGDRMMEENTQTLLETKWNWGKGVFDDIHWKGIREVVDGFSVNKKIFYSKLACGWLPTNAKRNVIEGVDAVCPLCGKAEETQSHLFQCDSTFNEHEYISINMELKKSGTCPIILAAIMFILKGEIPNESGDEECDAAIKRQCEIGAHNLWSERLSEKWGNIQSRFWDHQIHPKRNVEKWYRRVIGEIIGSAYNIWKHRNTVNNEGGGLESSNPGQLERRIRDLFDVRHKILPIDYPLYDKIKAILESKSSLVKTKWCESIERSIELHRATRGDFKQILITDYIKDCNISTCERCAGEGLEEVLNNRTVEEELEEVIPHIRGKRRKMNIGEHEVDIKETNVTIKEIVKENKVVSRRYIYGKEQIRRNPPTLDISESDEKGSMCLKGNEVNNDESSEEMCESREVNVRVKSDGPF